MVIIDQIVSFFTKKLKRDNVLWFSNFQKEIKKAGRIPVIVFPMTVLQNPTASIVSATRNVNSAILFWRDAPTVSVPDSRLKVSGFAKRVSRKNARGARLVSRGP